VILPLLVPFAGVPVLPSKSEKIEKDVDSRRRPVKVEIRRNFSIQIGSFVIRDQAIDLLKRFRDEFPEAVSYILYDSKDMLYKVRVYSASDSAALLGELAKVRRFIPDAFISSYYFSIVSEVEPSEAVQDDHAIIQVAVFKFEEDALSLRDALKEELNINAEVIKDGDIFSVRIKTSVDNVDNILEKIKEYFPGAFIKK
jgi:hypothetical protein